MPRIPRKFTVFPDSIVHKTWRGHNREPNIEDPKDKTKYLQFLNEEIESEKNRDTVELNALTLMDNHIHELYRVMAQPAFSELMRRHHSRYGMYFNKMKKRCGKVAQDRAHTTLTENDVAAMQMTFYIHANPLRSQMRRGYALNYPWSTHNLYAFGKRVAWMKNVKLPGWYLSLGDNSAARQKKYRRLYAAYLKETGIENKKSYSKPFFGNPVWVLAQMTELRDKMHELYHKEKPP